jgi:hypothetical protein
MFHVEHSWLWIRLRMNLYPSFRQTGKDEIGGSLHGGKSAAFGREDVGLV